MQNEPTVYIVDDDPAVLRFLDGLISTINLNVRLFKSAGAFLDSYEPGMLGCLLLDIRMPGMSGLQLIAAVRATSQIFHLPILVATGYSADPTRVACLQAGADFCMTKPFPRSAILPLLELLVLRRQQQLAAR